MAWTTVLVDPEAASMTTSTPLAVGELLHPGDRIVGPDIDRQLGAKRRAASRRIPSDEVPVTTTLSAPLARAATIAASPR